jgi:hypothetical protein
MKAQIQGHPPRISKPSPHGIIWKFPNGPGNILPAERSDMEPTGSVFIHQRDCYTIWYIYLSPKRLLCHLVYLSLTKDMVMPFSIFISH